MIIRGCRTQKQSDLIILGGWVHLGGKNEKCSEIDENWSRWPLEGVELKNYQIYSFWVGGSIWVGKVESVWKVYEKCMKSVDSV